MAEIVIDATPRKAGSSNMARRLRRERKLPAVLYGGGKDTRTITLNPTEIVSILKSESGQNTILKLTIDGGAEQDVMIFDVQIDPISRSLQHADLVRIAMDVQVEVSVPLHIVGDAIGVQEGGVLDHSLRELVVSCLPGNIPESIDVDVSELEMNNSIKVEDLVVPDDVEVITLGDRSVASIVAPVSEADLEADLGVDEELEADEAPAAGDAPDAAAEATAATGEGSSE